MIWGENFSEALGSLWDAKQRTLLALLGIVIGIGSVIAMVSAGEMVKNQVMKAFTDMGTDLLAVEPNQDSGTPRHIPFAAALRAPKYCPAITQVAPYTRSFVEVTNKGKSFNLTMLGVTQSFGDINKLKVLKGRFLSDLDLLMPFCVITDKVEKRLIEGGMQKVLGVQILVDNRILTICGVIRHEPMSGMRPDGLDSGILIPISMSFRMMSNPGVQAMLAKFREDAAWQTAANQIKGYFARASRHLDVNVRSAEQLIDQQQAQMRLFTLLLGAIGSISLIVGGVGVMNVMLVSVTERKKEIGIRRALGAMQKDIQQQFLMESLLLCVAGGVIGSFAGVGVAYGLAAFNHWDFFVSMDAIAIGVVVSCLVGIFFGFYPARQAARLSPIDALRSE
jgi:putative ABC transport system permease protein